MAVLPRTVERPRELLVAALLVVIECLECEQVGVEDTEETIGLILVDHRKWGWAVARVGHDSPPPRSSNNFTRTHASVQLNRFGHFSGNNASAASSSR